MVDVVRSAYAPGTTLAIDRRRARITNEENLVLCECWNTIGDIGAAVRSTTRKAAELGAIAAGRFGPDAIVGTVWIVRASARNRTLVGRYPEVFASRFTGSSRRWLEALERGVAPPGETGLIWCDVRATRLLAWRQRSEAEPGVLHSAPHDKDREE